MAHFLSILTDTRGAVAQLGERLLCTEEVRGSNPLSSTIVDNRKNPLCPSGKRPPVSQAMRATLCCLNAMTVHTRRLIHSTVKAPSPTMAASQVSNSGQ